MKIKLQDQEHPLLNFFLVVLATLVTFSIVIPYIIFWLLLGEQPQFN